MLNIVVDMGLSSGKGKLYILHLGNYLLVPDSGVAQKTFSVASVMRKAGCSVHCVAFPFLYSGKAESTADVEVIHVPESRVYVAMEEYLSGNLTAEDRVLFRYPFASVGLLMLMRKFGRQIIFEHNTIEGVEMLMLQKSHLGRLPKSLSPSYLKYAFQTLVLKSTDETRYGPEILKHALGGVCVSKEIDRYEKGRCPSYCTTVIANGVQITLSETPKTPLMDGVLRVCMIIGSSAVWHGYDRLIQGLARYDSTQVRIEIDIIGLFAPEKPLPEIKAPHAVRWLGPMSRGEIAQHLKSCHLAVGTLALHRKKMQEASPLKVRECLMLGLPMIIGYYDSDISPDKRFEHFIHAVPNNDMPIDWTAVVEFYKLLARNANHRAEIAALAASVLTMDAKGLAYLRFIESLE